MTKQSNNRIKFQLAMASKLFGKELTEREGVAAAELLAALQHFDGFTFEIEKDEEGWSAQCVDIPEIITSDTNPNATNEEIDSNIKDAIFTAFGLSELDQDALERIDTLERIAKKFAEKTGNRNLVRFVIPA